MAESEPGEEAAGNGSVAGDSSVAGGYGGPAGDEASMQKYTKEEVSQHNSQKDLWIIIGGKVYDVTRYQKKHPGGASVMLQHAGRDATEAANAAHKTDMPAFFMQELLVGTVLEVEDAEAGATRAESADGASEAGDVDAGRKSLAKALAVNETVSESGPKGEEADGTGINRDADGSGIQTASLDLLELEAAVAEEVAATWHGFAENAGSIEAAGDAIYSALFESAPSLQAMFTTPRAVQGMRFVNGISSFVAALRQPAHLKELVETLAFGHLSIEVTVPRVTVFRDAIVDLLEVEMSETFSSEARDGWISLLNYVGGAIIFVKAHYADRLRILEGSWAKCSGRAKPAAEQAAAESEERRRVAVRSGNGNGNAIGSPKNGSPGSSFEDTGSPRTSAVIEGAIKLQSVPTTFKEMFEFNAAVMGLGTGGWLREVLNSFDAIVLNVANSARLQEECDILVIRISRVAKGQVKLNLFRSCMLASLRSLLPKDWDSSHEVAWNWLWENVETLLKKTLGKPPAWERALSQSLSALDEAHRYEIRSEVYEKFFAVAPSGGEYFKQSDTRLHFIAEKITAMALEFFQDPWQMTDDISALGLRHVGYGIPTELFGPFVSSYIEVLTPQLGDPLAQEAFRWSLGLIAEMLTRTIQEGSTIVMRAVNINSARQLKRAIRCAPRGERAAWLLQVQVGTQSISPLAWAIESGSLDAAQAILDDLLTIRADRERYYYGVDELFARHPDIVQRLCQDAPNLVLPFLDGLVWRSKETKRGLRRVNYYIKNIIVDANGGVSDALRWFVAVKDPKLMTHPVLVLVSDTLWNGVVRRQFIFSKIWFIVSLVVFFLSQAILPQMSSVNEKPSGRIAIFCGRVLIYVTTMMRLLLRHMRSSRRDFAARHVDRVVCLPVPRYLKDAQEVGSFLLAVFLVLMCTHEPMFWCARTAGSGWPTDSCDGVDALGFRYSVFGMFAIMIHWLLLADLSVFSTGLSAFVLVCVQVLSEIGRFLIALIFLLLTFSSAISVLEHNYDVMRDIPHSIIALFAITIKLFQDDYRNAMASAPLLVAVLLFVMSSCVVLLNLLIAQLNSSYEFIYQDMVGFARIKRADVIVETLGMCPADRWSRFVASLEFDSPLEFNEGDVGPPGGLQVLEPAMAHTVTADSIRRFGGSCASDMRWPEELKGNEDEDKYERIERLVKKALKRITLEVSQPGAATSGSFMSSGASSRSSSSVSDR